MKKPLYILLVFVLISCGDHQTCSTQKIDHQLNSIRISLPSCYDFIQPDSTENELTWIVKGDTLKFVLQLDQCLTAGSLDSLDPDESYTIEKDTIDQNYLLTTAVRKNYRQSYQKEKEESVAYDFENQPFWFSVNDLTKSTTHDTTFIQITDTSFIPIIDLKNNCILIGYTFHLFKTFRPRPDEIDRLIKDLKKMKIKTLPNKNYKQAGRQ